MMQEIMIRTLYPFDNKVQILMTEAPNTLRIPISFTRWLTTNSDNPNKPRQLIRTANMQKMEAKFPTCSSDLNFIEYSSSTKV